MELVLNGERVQAAKNATVSDLLASLGVSEKGVAVERNLEIVPKSAFAETTLKADDRLEIIQFVGGG